MSATYNIFNILATKRELGEILEVLREGDVSSLFEAFSTFSNEIHCQTHHVGLSQLRCREDHFQSQPSIQSTAVTEAVCFAKKLMLAEIGGRQMSP